MLLLPRSGASYVFSAYEDLVSIVDWWLGVLSKADAIVVDTTGQPVNPPQQMASKQTTKCATMCHQVHGFPDQDERRLPSPFPLRTFQGPLTKPVRTHRRKLCLGNTWAVRGPIGGKL